MSMKPWPWLTTPVTVPCTEPARPPKVPLSISAMVSEVVVVIRERSECGVGVYESDNLLK